MPVTDHDIARRQILRATGVVAAAAGLNLLPPVAFGAGPGGAQGSKNTDRTETRTVTGTFPTGEPDYFYLPVDVPKGVNRIDVSYSYDWPAVSAGQRGNACDIGLFGPEGIEPGNARGFRGWSGGFRSEFFVSAAEATPGYLAGPVTAGRWHVVLGPYTVAPVGLHWSVTITLTYGAPGRAFRPHPAPLRAPARDRGTAWYRGDSHLHTVHSDGRRTPAELVAAARAAGLDYITSTEHNTPSAQLQWGDVATADLLILNGEEVTTRSGHWPAIGLPAGTWIDWRYRSTEPTQFQRFVDEVHAHGGLVTAAHPFANCFGCAFEYDYEPVDLVEVWNGPWSADDEATVLAWQAMLRGGHVIPAVGNSDAHNPDQVVGLPQTVVLATGLERGALLRGLQGGRSWIAESSAVDLTFTASTLGRTVAIGSTVKPGLGAPVEIAVTVSGAPDTTIVLIDQTGRVLSGAVGSTGTGELRWTTYRRYSSFVRVEVRRAPTLGAPGAMVAMTNPIYLAAPGS